MFKFVIPWLIFTTILIWLEYLYIDKHDGAIDLDYILIPIIVFIALFIYFGIKAKQCKRRPRGRGGFKNILQ